MHNNEVYMDKQMDNVITTCIEPLPNDIALIV